VITYGSNGEQARIRDRGKQIKIEPDQELQNDRRCRERTMRSRWRHAQPLIESRERPRKAPDHDPITYSDRHHNVLMRPKECWARSEFARRRQSMRPIAKAGQKRCERQDSDDRDDPP